MADSNTSVLPSVDELSEKNQKSAALIRRYALYSTGSSFLPSTVLDIAAMTAIQTKMITDLGKLYGFQPSEQMIRTAVTSGITALGGRVLSGTVSGLAQRITPLKGMFGSLMEAAFSGFLTAELGLYYQSQMALGRNPGDIRVIDIVDHITAQIKAGKFNPTRGGGLRNQFAYLFPASDN